MPLTVKETEEKVMLESFTKFYDEWARVLNNACGFCTTIRELMEEYGLTDAYDKAVVRTDELKAIK